MHCLVRLLKPCLKRKVSSKKHIKAIEQSIRAYESLAKAAKVAEEEERYAGDIQSAIESATLAGQAQAFVEYKRTLIMNWKMYIYNISSDGKLSQKKCIDLYKGGVAICKNLRKLEDSGIETSHTKDGPNKSLTDYLVKCSKSLVNVVNDMEQNIVTATKFKPTIIEKYYRSIIDSIEATDPDLYTAMPKTFKESVATTHDFMLTRHAKLVELFYIEMDGAYILSHIHMVH